MKDLDKAHLSLLVQITYLDLIDHRYWAMLSIDDNIISWPWSFLFGYWI